MSSKLEECRYADFKVLLNGAGNCPAAADEAAGLLLAWTATA